MRASPARSLGATAGSWSGLCRRTKQRCDGRGNWINGGSAAKHQLRADFAVPPALHAELEHASLFYAGVGYSLAWLNGERVAPEEALGPWTTWQTRILHRCEDVTAMLRPGANALGVWLGGGQYDSTWTHAWFKGPHGTSPPLGLRLLLRLFNLHCCCEAL